MVRILLLARQPVRLSLQHLFEHTTFLESAWQNDPRGGFYFAKYTEFTLERIRRTFKAPRITVAFDLGQRTALEGVV